MSQPQSITLHVKVKYLWLVIGILLTLLATSPIYYTHVAALYTSSSSSSSGSSGSSGPQSGATSSSGAGSSSNGQKVTCGNPCNIYIKNSIFGYNVSQTQVINRGTTVIWHNIDDTEHTTTSNTGVWGSPILPPGKSYSFTFQQSGKYPYHCEIHPMTGTIVVVS